MLGASHLTRIRFGIIPLRWTSRAQSVKRVAKRAADAKLSSEVLREMMQACSTSRKNAMRRAKAAGNQSRAREADRSDASSLAVIRNKEGGGGAGGGMPFVFPACLPHIEQFVLEFEEAVGNVEGMEAPVRQSLVAAARARTGVPSHPH